MAVEACGRSKEQRGEEPRAGVITTTDGSPLERPAQRLRDDDDDNDDDDDDEEATDTSLATPTESSALLGNSSNANGGGKYDPESGEPKKARDWDQLPAPGEASWGREVKMVLKSSPPLIITFFLQFSINATSVFAVGRLGLLPP
ncbi:hypothetical protein ISF_06695 [Cordyceps fumosorosea ARSEF 2679]|uniref:Uncharacterized protein n=1 Tax=Cordyceps fumosorosea (strain ARSEF 2679) TaxID=1081104 RepID=A0A167R0C9_CORFA|nr:hypothetical protein ISF_06695 [Cordyceps fumosorosea ARSEF 2679]OAA58156.1 hypothetical protein ISF_06695 [Cordyceps fumosorosea ARSEF 2679]